MSGIHILVGDSYGIYVPQTFCRDMVDEWNGVPDESVETCRLGPDEDWYWDAWTEVLDRAQYKDQHGNVWHLYQDGDLFAYCRELMTDEEHEQFFGEPRVNDGDE